MSNLIARTESSGAGGWDMFVLPPWAFRREKRAAFSEEENDRQ
jgi:hypothetical protein